MGKNERNILVGNRIKEARSIRGMTLDDVAEEVKVAKSTIQRYETAQIQSLKMPVIEAIANTLGVNPVWLMGEDAPMEKDHPMQLGDFLDDVRLKKAIRYSQPEQLKEFNLSKKEMSMVEKYRTLDYYGTDLVDTVLNKEYERCCEQREDSELVARSRSKHSQDEANQIANLIDRETKK